MRFASLVLVIAGVLVGLGGAASDASAAGSCGSFVVGEANSTAYADRELPARGTAQRASCVTLKRIARRMHDGTYPVPSKAGAPAPDYGAPFAVRDRGKRWSCRLQNRGASGPSYAVRCTRPSGSRLRWSTG